MPDASVSTIVNKSTSPSSRTKFITTEPAGEAVTEISASSNLSERTFEKKFATSAAVSIAAPSDPGAIVYSAPPSVTFFPPVSVVIGFAGAEKVNTCISGFVT